jgi:hypothetical protein
LNFLNFWDEDCESVNGFVVWIFIWLVHWSPMGPSGLLDTLVRYARVSVIPAGWLLCVVLKLN